MPCFDFTHAIVRTPGRSVVDGLHDNPDARPHYDGIAREHTAYVSALRAAGLIVDILPPLEEFPDSVFVEDPAFVVPEGAILLRPGAPSRLAEREDMREALTRHFGRVFELGEGEYADGGDVLITPRTIFIGLSKRTNRAGAESLRDKLAALGRDASIVETPPQILHFKTACALLSEDTILATRAMAGSGFFDAFRLLIVPAGEDGAANALRVKDTVFVADSFPRTRDMIHRQGLAVQPLGATEIAKLDAGLSCMSLRW